ncbi:MAG: response regulator [Oceanospirillaceae bacterium]|nr:response regulator [Oceanospirillaceae bacterium]
MIKTVMIIDDETQVLNALQRMLVRSGWQVITFVNPSDALEFARHRIVPLVITDFRMPRMTGIEFLQSLEEIQPVSYKIMLSACASRADIVQAVASVGVHCFMQKPWDSSRLLGELNSGLEYFRLILRAEYMHNKDMMSAQEFGVWYNTLLNKIDPSFTLKTDSDK